MFEVGGLEGWRRRNRGQVRRLISYVEANTLYRHRAFRFTGRDLRYGDLEASPILRLGHTRRNRCVYQPDGLQMSKGPEI